MIMSDLESGIDRLMGELGELGWLKTVRIADGDKDSGLQMEIDRLIETYPFLQKSEQYVTFLRRYGGALLVRDDDGFLLSFFGFSHDIGVHLTEGPGEPIEEDCLIFCDLIVPREGAETCAVAFGFAATPDLRWGVYRFDKGSERSWCCETFFEWLRLIITTRGRLFD
jgi:hypothetical protein